MYLYNFVDYCGMLTDEKRLDAYVKALKDTINSDSVVLDLGAGTGIFSMLACEFGAKKVYSVEMNPLIKLLEGAIAEKGYESKIEIIQKLSNEIELEEKANVMVSDIHGGFPLFESSIETIIDARDRLLTDDAILIPRKESIYFAVSQSEKIYEKNVKTFLKDFHGFKIPMSERFVLNRWFGGVDEDEKLLSKPRSFLDIDFKTIEETSFAKELSWKIKEDGIAHGLRGWFENELSDNNGVSNGVENKKTTYASPYFPFENEVEVIKGDVVKAHITAKYEKKDYTWSWRTQIFENGKKDKVKADFNQSMLASIYLDPKTVLKTSEYFAPQHNDNAEIDLLVLNNMNGEMLLGDIADLLVEKFPKKFKTFDDAFDYVGKLSQHYSK